MSLEVQFPPWFTDLDGSRIDFGQPVPKPSNDSTFCGRVWEDLSATPWASLGARAASCLFLGLPMAALLLLSVPSILAHNGIASVADGCDDIRYLVSYLLLPVMLLNPFYWLLTVCDSIGQGILEGKPVLDTLRTDEGFLGGRFVNWEDSWLADRCFFQ